MRSRKSSKKSRVKQRRSRYSIHTPNKRSRKRKLSRHGSKYNDKKSKKKIYNLLKTLLNKRSVKKTRKIPRKKVYSKDLKKPGGWRTVQREYQEKRALDQITNGIQNLLNKTMPNRQTAKNTKNIRSPQYISAVLRNAGLLKKSKKLK